VISFADLLKLVLKGKNIVIVYLIKVLNLKIAMDVIGKNKTIALEKILVK